ncbi:hypothetical protein IIB34_02540 [PVC group bacterium]|nr:hypothetical protein [PVC group bacterium]
MVKNVKYKKIDEVFGLDKNGRVWKYVPAGKGKNHYAFWTRLTARGSMYIPKEEEAIFKLIEDAH